MRQRADARSTRPWLSALVLVALSFVVLVLLVVGVDRFIAYDEGLYLLEAQNLGESRFWGKHRALGIPLLLFPILPLIDISHSFIRYWFVILNAALMIIAFGMWQKLVGRAAILAAALLSVSWPVLVYAPTALPNLPAGLAALGLLAAFLLRLEQGDGWVPAILGLGVFLAIVRPTATAGIFVVTTGTVFVAWLRERRIHDRTRIPLSNPWGHLVPLFAAFSIGGVVWIFDSFRLNGPVDRFLSVVSFTGSVEGESFGQLWQYLSRLDNYTSSGSISVLDVTLGLFLLVGVTAAVSPAGSVLPTQRRAVVAALTLSLLFFGTYLTHYFVDVRLLLPAWCALTIPVAVGYERVVGSGPPALKWLAIAGLGVIATWSTLTASQIANEYDTRADNARFVAEYLKEDSAGTECRFATDRDTIQIEVASGCLGVTVVGSTWFPPRDLRLDPGDDSTQRYAVYWGNPETKTFYDSWPVHEIDTGTIIWRVYKEPPRN